MFSNSPDLAALLLGALAGVLLTIVLSFPRIARGIGKIAAVSLMGAGAGLITWGLISALNGSDFESLQMGPVIFYSAAQTLGWGVGCLVAGITALVIAFIGPPRGHKGGHGRGHRRGGRPDQPPGAAN